MKGADEGLTVAEGKKKENKICQRERIEPHQMTSHKKYIYKRCKGETCTQKLNTTQLK